MAVSVFSSLMLCLMAAWAGARCVDSQPFYNKWLGVIILLIFAAPAAVGVCYFSGFEAVKPVMDFLISVEITMTCLLLIVFTWGLINLKDIGPWLFSGALLLGAFLFYLTWGTSWQPLQQVIQSFCLIVAMVVAIYGLARRQSSGMWMVLALMSLAFSLKTQLFVAVMPPLSANYSLKSLALYFLARAMTAKGFMRF